LDKKQKRALTERPYTWNYNLFCIVQPSIASSPQEEHLATFVAFSNL